MSKINNGIVLILGMIAIILGWIVVNDNRYIYDLEAHNEQLANQIVTEMEEKQ